MFEWIKLHLQEIVIFFTEPRSSIVGWLATAIQASSFFLKPRPLKLVLGIGSLVWLAYGVLLESKPVIVSNLIVTLSIAISYFRNRT